ncbi:hypothetical protein BSL78_11638 [Apostichopus japonicus]|uniref:Protein Wnt n=1 Tax=Stichopus japonicus TaxID=307972 RepID=A0A2G8KTY5_STIJA|nr:hypothetical protein BSL78_11638 [Apostichopus japonicus]
MNAGFRETAFIYAITTAAVTHSVARACSEGSISTCSCADRNKGPSGDDWEWGGCSDNAVYGHRFARKFVDSGERGKDSRNLMNIHNNEAGRRMVEHNTIKQCKCHGMSGSCELKTCWKQTPQFRDVANKLVEKYNDAMQVRPRNSNSGQLETVSNHVNVRGRNSPASQELIYLERSPDFCTPDASVGSAGTRGRYCNKTSTGYDGCDSMCCGRGYNVSLKESVEWCNCTFHWCCFVKCRKCHTEEWVNQCK